MSAPWRSALRLAHGLHRRLPAEWRTCKVEGCGAVPVGRPDEAVHCLRHLPDAQARKDAINAMLRRLTVTPTDSQVVVDLRGTTFDERLLNETLGMVREAEPTEDAPALSWSFRMCVFTGRADFTAKVFGGVTHPQQDYVDFTDAHFTAEAVFAGARFHGRVFFQDTRFTAADFDQAEFGHDAWFLDTQCDTASFADATFAGAANLLEVKASYALGFVGATFDGPASLESITAPVLDVTQAMFAKRATLELTGSFTADYARFDDGVDVRLRNDLESASTVSLTGVRLGAPSTVTGQVPTRHRRDTEPDGSPFEWITALPRLLSLACADVAELTVTDVDLAHCLFAGAVNLDKLRLGGTTPFARPARRYLSRRRWHPGGDRPVGREMLVEELVARLGADEALGADRDPRGPAGGHVTDDQLAVLYRALRKAREDAKDEPGAGDFYLGEMEARRSGTRKIAEWLILSAYRGLSGYGLRAGRALVWLFGLVALLTVLLVVLGLPDTAGPIQRMTGTLQPPGAAGAPRDVAIEVRTVPVILPPPDRRWSLARVERAARVATGSVLFRDSDQQLTTAGRWTVNTGRLLGPLLIALAALAIRARVKR